MFNATPVRFALASTATAAMAAAACAPATRETPAPAPAPAHYTSPTTRTALARAGAPRAVRWTGTCAPGAGRGRALALHLTDGAHGSLTGELVLHVTPRASTFRAGAGPAAALVRITVPVARGRYAGGQLVLDTDAYYDAGCECTLAGIFRAAVRGDTLTGTYVTRGPATAATVRGRWRAVRSGPSAELTADPDRR